MADKQQVIIVGGGLAGLSAAHSVIENGGKVIVLEKKMVCGGSSVCATSGINGAPTQAQKDANVPDSAEIFCKDTAKSAALGDENAQPSELCKILCYKSAHAIDWLSNRFDIDLSLVSRLGGHSQPRTHRGKEKMPGMTITNTLLEKLKEIQKNSKGEIAQIITKADAKTLIMENGEVVGCEYMKNKKLQKAYGPVIICSGGFAADFSKDSLLLKFRPDLAKFSTTNPNHANGDGIRMCEKIGADLVDMTYIQVHPTGLVNEKDPNKKEKLLAAEALRGVGGIILNADGERFCNELGRRDYVSNCMINNKGPFRQILNTKSQNELLWHIKHYTGRGLMKKMSATELAQTIGISIDKLEDTFNKYKEDAKKGTDKYDKKFFAHADGFDINDTFAVSIVTPVVHYTMGGVHIDGNSNIVSKDSKAIQGLYAAGEVCGAVHGKNRLGGNSLLDCVVFGILCGQSAMKYLDGKVPNRAASRLATLNQQFKK